MMGLHSYAGDAPLSAQTKHAIRQECCYKRHSIFASGLISHLKSTSKLTQQSGRVALLMKLDHKPSGPEGVVLTNIVLAPQE